MKIKSKTMPKGFAVMWAVFAVIYAVWMTVFMRYDTYPCNETGIFSPVMFYVWTALSTLIFLFYPFMIKKLLFDEQTNVQKILCMVLLIFSCVFITVYGFLKNPFEYTASMIGLYFPRCFKVWGVFAPMAVFTNTLYMFRKFNYYSPLCVVLSSIGCGAMYVTINVPSAGEDLILTSLRCMSHWTGALVFAFLGAAPVVLFLLHQSKGKDKKFTAAAVIFIAILALMIILLVTVGKDGLIENLPMWAVFILLFMINYTNIFSKKESLKVKEKQTVAK